MTYECLHDPGPLSEDRDNVGKADTEEMRTIAREHTISKGWQSLDANTYAQGYVEGKQQLEISRSNAEGFTTGYGLALDGFVQARLSGERASDESARDAREANLYILFNNEWPNQPDRVAAGMEGYRYANEKLGNSPPSAQAYAYGYARAFVEHLPGMAASESPGEILREKTEALCG